MQATIFIFTEVKALEQGFGQQDTFGHKSLRPGPNPIKLFFCLNLRYTDIWPIREAKIGHVTDVIGQISA